MDLALRAVIGESYEPRVDETWSQMDWADGIGKHCDVPWFPIDRSNIDEWK
jgi:putative xylitol transport system substrate-binding protein